VNSWDDPPELLPRNLTWQLKAACLGLYEKSGEDLFFSPDNPGGPKNGRGIKGERERIEKAKAICVTCPVMWECLDYAITNESHGIWGGMTDAERRKVTRHRKLLKAAREEP
jgi:WhiB family transcriptional regulator, redox-sensing transcriptional regulator